MREYQAKESSLNLKIGFRDILANLPVPGTSEFSDLRLSLKPFGLKGDSCSVEPAHTTAQTMKLSAVRVNFSLLNDTIFFRVGYEGIEISIPAVLDNSAELAVGIFETILGSFKEQEVAVSSASVQSTAHLELDHQDPRHYLNEQFQINHAKLVPDAFAVEINPLDGSPVKSCRIVVARSLRFETSLFLDFVANYEFDDSFSAAGFLVTARSDYKVRLGLLGLRSKGLSK